MHSGPPLDYTNCAYVTGEFTMMHLDEMRALFSTCGKVHSVHIIPLKVGRCASLSCGLLTRFDVSFYSFFSPSARLSSLKPLTG